MTVEILGTPYTIVEKSVTEDELLTDCDGYCDWTTKTIVIEREMDGTLGNMDEYIKKVKRHEIIHAFLFECGLAESSHESKAWGLNEEMVDWIAYNGVKLLAAWVKAGAI